MRLRKTNGFRWSCIISNKSKMNAKLHERVERVKHSDTYAKQFESIDLLRIIRRRRIEIFSCSSCNCVAEYINNGHPDNGILITRGWFMCDCPNCGQQDMSFDDFRMEEISE